MTEKLYVGVEKDTNAGLTHLGRMVRDAWVFGILPETETCAGWSGSEMQNLYEKVHAAWEPYAHLPSRLPDELQQRHTQIYAQAIVSAKNSGWNPELEDDD
jgi:membrane peptidoglycan carboxypeptidase